MKWRTFYSTYRQVIPPDAKRILEIGVWHGSGLRWLHQNWPDAELFGMDRWYWEGCTSHNDWTFIQCNECQITPEVLQHLGTLDVVIDDAGHRPYQQARAFKLLWPQVSENGIYIIEDLEYGQKWFWRIYSKFFGIQPILRRLIAHQSTWANGDSPGWREPAEISFTPNLVIIRKSKVWMEIGTEVASETTLIEK